MLRIQLSLSYADNLGECNSLLFVMGKLDTVIHHFILIQETRRRQYEGHNTTLAIILTMAFGLRCFLFLLPNYTNILVSFLYLYYLRAVPTGPISRRPTLIVGRLEPRIGGRIGRLCSTVGRLLESADGKLA